MQLEISPFADIVVMSFDFIPTIWILVSPKVLL